MPIAQQTHTAGRSSRGHRLNRCGGSLHLVRQRACPLPLLPQFRKAQSDRARRWRGDRATHGWAATSSALRSAEPQAPSRAECLMFDTWCLVLVFVLVFVFRGGQGDAAAGVGQPTKKRLRNWQTEGRPKSMQAVEHGLEEQSACLVRTFRCCSATVAAGGLSGGSSLL